MIEYLVLIVFIVLLLSSAILQYPILFALIASLILFILYAFYCGFSSREIATMLHRGFNNTAMILIVFLLIGMITGIWRSSGTIAYMIYYGAHFISPRYFFVGLFLFNSLISVLTGTSFGTASTAGVISMSLARAVGISPVVAGGAVLSGVFLGDRSSPMSTSALLIATLTGTDLWRNLKNMIRTAILPFLLTLLFFQWLNLSLEVTMDMRTMEAIKDQFIFHPLLIAPALTIILLSMKKVNIRISMSLSIVTAVLIALFIQNRSFREVGEALLIGFHSSSSFGELIHGGGMISMVRACFIIAISSGFFGIFQGTDLLLGIKRIFSLLATKLPPFFLIVLTSVFLSLFSSNQTLSIMLTHEMAKDSIEDGENLALYLENSAVFTPVYIPWNIAGRTPIETTGMPLTALFYSFYLHAVILVNIGAELFR